ncbi:uncharacterized protein LOC123689550 isoform X38 [Pieris rapae]|uniref:uncharacterized protein LOC123689550 isoform X38 n=1 Tax=Pieris rapae TaxID=64459 RepID=UPI001E280C77|nr:uncharacterized protein LOC123689550 isoform X38 [Pieris rapae]
MLTSSAMRSCMQSTGRGILPHAIYDVGAVQPNRTRSMLLAIDPTTSAQRRWQQNQSQTFQAWAPALCQALDTATGNYELMRWALLKTPEITGLQGASSGTANCGAHLRMSGTAGRASSFFADCGLHLQLPLTAAQACGVHLQGLPTAGCINRLHRLKAASTGSADCGVLYRLCRLRDASPVATDLRTGFTVCGVHLQALPIGGVFLQASPTAGCIYRLCRLRDASPVATDCRTGFTDCRVHLQAPPTAGCIYRLCRLRGASTGSADCGVHLQALPTAGCIYRLCRLRGASTGSADCGVHL